MPQHPTWAEHMFTAVAVLRCIEHICKHRKPQKPAKKNRKVTKKGSVIRIDSRILNSHTWETVGYY